MQNCNAKLLWEYRIKLGITKPRRICNWGLYSFLRSTHFKAWTKKSYPYSLTFFPLFLYLTLLNLWMHTQLLSPKSPLPTNGLPSRSFLSTSPKPLFPFFSSNSLKTQNNRVVNCRGIEVSVLSSCSNSLNSSNNGSLGSLRLNVKDVDIATLGNLCVDIVLNVPELPPEPLYERKAYMERLASSPPDKVGFIICLSMGRF